jgi:hypothetical protein
LTPTYFASNIWERLALLIFLDISERITLIFEHKYFKFMYFKYMRALFDLLLDLLCFLLRGGGGLR